MTAKIVIREREGFPNSAANSGIDLETALALARYGYAKELVRCG